MDLSKVFTLDQDKEESLSDNDDCLNGLEIPRRARMASNHAAAKGEPR